MKTIKNAHDQLLNIFEIYGIEAFNPTGKIYDPNTQEAFLTVPLEEGK